MHFIKVISIFLGLCLTVTLAQDDGQYRPPITTTTTRRPFYYSSLFTTTRRPNYSRYRGGNDGRYVPVPVSNDGRYVPSNEGRYIHQDVPYRPGGGEYSGDAGGYVGGGQYRGDKDAIDRSRAPVEKQTTTAPPTSPRSTASFRPYTYTTTTFAPRPTIKGNGNGNGGGGWKIIRWDKEEPKDGYHYLYETENGILGEESGRVENTGKDDEGLKAKGFYEYTGNDGNLYRVDYSADENGFNPQGDHILPVPDSVKRTLEWLRANGDLE